MQDAKISTLYRLSVDKIECCFLNIFQKGDESASIFASLKHLLFLKHFKSIFKKVVKITTKLYNENLFFKNFCLKNFFY